MVFLVLILSTLTNGYNLTQGAIQGYYPMDVIRSFLEWHEQNTEQASLVQLEGSFKGEEIPMLRMGTGDDFTTLIVGGVHADELLGVSAVLDLIDYLASSDSFIRKSLTLYFLPVLNVDSYAYISKKYNQTGSIFPVQNNQHKTPECPDGVDLNRNFDFSPETCGTSHDEPETQALKQILDKKDVSFVLTFSAGNHSYYYSQRNEFAMKAMFQALNITNYDTFDNQENSFAKHVAENYPCTSVEIGLSDEKYPDNFSSILDLHRNSALYLLERVKPHCETSYSCEDKACSINAEIKDLNHHSSTYYMKISLPNTQEATNNDEERDGNQDDSEIEDESEEDNEKTNDSGNNEGSDSGDDNDTDNPNQDDRCGGTQDEHFESLIEVMKGENDLTCNYKLGPDIVFIQGTINDTSNIHIQLKLKQPADLDIECVYKHIVWRERLPWSKGVICIVFHTMLAVVFAFLIGFIIKVICKRHQGLQHHPAEKA